MLVDSVKNLVDCLSQGTPSTPMCPSRGDMVPWRDRIDVLDQTILCMINERMKCANAIGAVKKHLGIPVYAPDREEEVIRNVISQNEGPLPNAAVRRVFERIIDETRSLERHRYQDDDQKEP